MITARRVRALRGFRGTAWLWCLSEPADVGYGTQPIVAEWIVTSSADVPYSGPETYAFASDPNGKVQCWTELPGSERGRVTHETVIARVVARANGVES